MDTFSRRLGQIAAAALVSWFITGTGLWVLGGPTGGTALASAIGCTLALALGSWWMSGRFRLVSTPWPLLVGVHAVLAFAFGSVMVLVTYSFQSAALDSTLGEAARTGGFPRAEYLFWIWLYVIVAVAAYAIRTRETLRAERERVAASEARLASARLDTMRGQLNPHFLFNALHSVGALVRRDPAQAGRAIERLADLLRYSLDEADDGMVALSEELAFNRTYLELMGLALGDRLRVTVSVDPNADDPPVPPFSLQTLTENSVRHGVTPNRNGGEVSIRVRSEADAIEMIVENDVASSPPDADSRHGRGLANLRVRLDALYGGRAQLETGMVGDRRFRARLRIPAS